MNNCGCNRETNTMCDFHLGQAEDMAERRAEERAGVW